MSGIIGITGGVITTLAMMNFSLPVFYQAISLLGIGLGLGTILGLKVAVT